MGKLTNSVLILLKAKKIANLATCAILILPIFGKKIGMPTF